jgi:hypothetical protein
MASAAILLMSALKNHGLSRDSADVCAQKAIFKLLAVSTSPHPIFRAGWLPRSMPEFSLAKLGRTHFDVRFDPKTTKNAAAPHQRR